MTKLLSLLRSGTIKDTLISFVGLGVTTIIGFLFTVLLARFLGPSDFGVFSAVSALIAICYSLGDMGISSAIINFLPKKVKEEDKVASTAIRVELMTAVLIALIFLLGSLLSTKVIPGSKPEFFWLAGLLSINYLFIGFVQGVFTAKRFFWQYSFSQVIDAVLKMSLVIVIYKLSRLSISLILISNIISTIISLVYSFSASKTKYTLPFSRVLFGEIYHFAKWIALSRFFSVFVSRIDVLLLNLLAGSYTAGIFSAANRITFVFALLVSSLGSVVNPRFSKFTRHSEIVSYIKKMMLLMVGISLVMILSSLFASPIIHFVFGDKYLAAIPIFQVLVFAMIPFIFTLATVPAVTFSFNNPRFVALATAFQVISMVIIELIFIPKIGAYAPPLAIGISNLFVLAATALEIRRNLALKEV